jgi:glycerol uptake facilitator-like aquaporin
LSSISGVASASGAVPSDSWWTASGSFANPAITVARSLSDSFAGIRPVDAPGFVVAQLVGALTEERVARWLFAKVEPQSVADAPGETGAQGRLSIRIPQGFIAEL